MRYFGGKAKIAKPLAAFLNTQLNDSQPFVDLFCGSCNVISKIDDKRERVANDLHYELISLHNAVKGGQSLPTEITEDTYKDMRNDNNTKYPAWLRGFAGFGCAFSGDWFKGYAKCNRGDDYCGQARNSLMKKHSTMTDVSFNQGVYADCTLPESSLVYCDIPYKNTTKYSTGAFNHEEFYDWAVKTQEEGHTILVSEYEHNVPEGWEVVWRHESKKDIRNKEGVQEKTVEVLMTPKKDN
jgi:DNA adenine methylase